MEGVAGSDVTFDCDLVSFENVTALSVNKGLDNVHTSQLSMASSASVQISDVNAMVDINVAEEVLNFRFSNVSCDVEGEYTLRLNLPNGVEETVQLYISGKYTHILNYMYTCLTIKNLRKRAH